MLNQRMRVFITQNLDLDPRQAINEIHNCIETEVFQYAVCKRDVLYGGNVVYQGLDILVRSLKDENGGLYNYCPCPCGLVFDINLIPYRQIGIEYVPEQGQQVQVEVFDLQQHLLDVQMQMLLPIEQIMNRPPQIMDEQEQQQFLMQYQNFARNHYQEYLQQMMAQQELVDLPPNVPNDNIQDHVENPQEHIQQPQVYALNINVAQPIQEQEEVVADEEEDESDEEQDESDEEMEIDEDVAEAEEEANFIAEEEQVHVVPQPLQLIQELLQCNGISSTSSDNPVIVIGENRNRRNIVVQYNKINSTQRMEGDESESSDDEYDDGDWSTDSADESNDYY